MFMDARKPPTDIAGYDPVATAGDCTYDAEAADKAVAFFHRVLVFVKGLKAKEPFRLEPWQADIVRTIFGWKRPDGSRRYRQVFIEVPRKNGKTTLLAGLANYLLFCDAEAGAECYCAAGDRDQASLAWNSAAAMVRNSSLSKRCKVRDSTKRIIYDGSFLRAIAANEGGAHGFDVHFAVCDELHVWPDRSMYDVLHTGTGARLQPLEVYITTAGWDRNSICWEVLTTARQVRDQQIDDNAFLPVIYEATEDEDWTDPAVWRKANPNLGVSVTEDFLARECKKAQDNPAYENTFRRLYLNQWTSQESRWLQMEKWRDCEVIPGDIGDGAQVFGGLDLSSVVDVTAWMIAQRVDNGWKLRGHYFIPEGRMREAEKRDRVPYSQWVKAGWVTATPGEAIDYSYVHDRILADAKRYNFGVIGYDPWNAEPTRIFLENEGLTMLIMRQGAKSMNLPCKELERAILEGVLDHGNDPVLAWMAENVQVKTDENGNIRPVKPDHAGSAKRIDGIVAGIMALGVGMITEPEVAGGFCVI
jgi:phage terminase large subunit-like protein